MGLSDGEPRVFDLGIRDHRRTKTLDCYTLETVIYLRSPQRERTHATRAVRGTAGRDEVRVPPTVVWTVVIILLIAGGGRRRRVCVIHEGGDI